MEVHTRIISVVEDFLQHGLNCDDANWTALSKRATYAYWTGGADSVTIKIYYEVKHLCPTIESNSSIKKTTELLMVRIRVELLYCNIDRTCPNRIACDYAAQLSSDTIGLPKPGRSLLCAVASMQVTQTLIEFIREVEMASTDIPSFIHSPKQKISIFYLVQPNEMKCINYFQEHPSSIYKKYKNIFFLFVLHSIFE